MNAQVRGFPTRDGQNPDPHDQPFGIHERLPSKPVPFEQRKPRGTEKLEKMPTRVADPVSGQLASGAGCGHGVLLSARDSPILPQLALLVKCRDPSISYLTDERSPFGAGSPEDLALYQEGRDPLTSNIAEGGVFLSTRGDERVPDC